MYSKKKILTYILAARPWSLTASIMPGVLGGILAYKEYSKINVTIAILALLPVILVHLGGNLANTYYDFINGVDSDVSDDNTLVSKLLEPEDIYHFAAVAYSCGILLFLMILPAYNTVNSVYLMAVFITGTLLSFLYSGGLELKYRALGDIVILLTFGPIITTFTYMSQVSDAAWMLLWKPIFYSLPLAFIAEAILHSNNFRDFEEDAKCGIVTLSILLGKDCSYYLYNILLVLPFCYLLYIVCVLSSYFLLPMLSMPLALVLHGRVKARDLKFLCQETAQFHLVFGLLYISAVYLSLQD